MSMSAPEQNAYDILNVAQDVSEADLRKAYRTQSLKVHPDRHPDDPIAGQKFHELTQAYELLKDPSKREALDASIRIQTARKERFASHDSKRKAFLEELEEGERQFKKQRSDKVATERAEASDLERIKEQSRKLRESKAKSKSDLSVPGPPAPKPSPVLGPLDTTVLIKFPQAKFQALTSAESVANFLSEGGYGPFDAQSIAFSSRASKKNPNKILCSAVVQFESVGDAYAAVSGAGRKHLEGITVTWASGKEPGALAELSRTDPAPEAGKSSSSPAPPSASAFDLESITLMKLRKAEREKLEQELREQDG